MSFSSFPCTQCGACCRRTAVLQIYGLPVTDEGDCTHLVETTDAEGQTVYACDIYAARPDICRIGYSRPENMSVERYTELTIAQCNAFQAEDEMPLRFRISHTSTSTTPQE